MARVAFVTSVVLLSVAGCASRHAEAPRAAAAAAPAAAVDPAAAQVAAGAVTPEGPVIVRLVGHNHPTITVTSGPDGPRYSAQERDGRVVVRGATLDELQANHPEVAKFVTPTMAVHADLDDVPGTPDARPIEPDARRDMPAVLMDASRRDE